MGTTEEIKIQAVMVVPSIEWHTQRRIEMSLRNVLGGDGLPLIGPDDVPKLKRALDYIEQAGIVKSRIREGTTDKEYQITEMWERIVVQAYSDFIQSLRKQKLSTL